MLELKKEIWDTLDSIYFVEKDLANFQQYSRRENMVFQKAMDDTNLEFTVINILKRIGLPNLSSYDIVACHRLKKLKKDKPTNVIVRFVNRKDAYVSLVNRNCWKPVKTRIPELHNLVSGKFIPQISSKVKLNMCVHSMESFISENQITVERDIKIVHWVNLNFFLNNNKLNNYKNSLLHMICNILIISSSLSNIDISYLIKNQVSVFYFYFFSFYYLYGDISNSSEL